MEERKKGRWMRGVGRKGEQRGKYGMRGKEVGKGGGGMRGERRGGEDM